MLTRSTPTLLVELEAGSNAGVRISALDGLRAVAVVAVILSHMFRGVFIGGFLGVDIFFVISGYIITERLLREHGRTGAISLRRFYMRRIKRLWPALWLFVLVSLMVCLATGRAWGLPLSAPAGWWDAAYALTSTMNIARASGHGGMSYVGHTWSLAAEEQFYLLWPAFLILGLKGRFRDHLPSIIFAAILIVMGWRIILVWQGASPLRIYMGPDARADVLLLGCLLALTGTRRLPRIFLKCWAVPAIILATLVLKADLSSSSIPLGGYTLIASCSAWLVAVSIENKGRFARIMNFAPIQWAGLRSYSLYLWHPLVIGLVEQVGLRQRYVAMIAVPVTAMIAELSYRYAENWLIRIRPPS